MSNPELEPQSELKFVVEPFDGERAAFVEDVIEPGKAAALNREIGFPISVMVLSEHIAIRTLRSKGEGRWGHTPIVDLIPGTLFRAGTESLVLVFNRGSSPVLKRKVDVDPQSEFQVE